MSKQLRNILVIGAACFAMFLALSFFLRYRQARQPGQLRLTMADAASTACRHNPAVIEAAAPGQIVSYCNCLSQTTVDRMSDAEIIAAADRGAPDAADRVRLSAAQQHCQARLRNGS